MTRGGGELLGDCFDDVVVGNGVEVVQDDLGGGEDDRAVGVLQAR